ncbi:hypothetical protein KQI84_11480 [bacterium]|nr:hypothetical protein [bacterium]
MFPFQSNREDRPWFLALIVIALVEAAIFFASSWFQGDGHFAMPIDRLRCQNAFVRNPLVPFSIGAALLALTAIWVYQLTARLTDCLGGALAAGLLLANGHIVFKYLAGMQTGLFLALAIGGLLGLAAWLQEEWPVGQWLGLLLLAAAALTRPEGAAITVAVFIVLLFRRDQTPSLPAWKVLISLVPFVFWLASMKLLSGTCRVSFGVLTPTPLGFWDSIERGGQTLVASASHFTGLQAAMGILALFGGALALLVEVRARRAAAGSLVFAAWVACFASVTILSAIFGDHRQSVVTLLVLAVPLGILGAKRLAHLFPAYEESAFKAFGLALLLLTIPTLLTQSAEYGKRKAGPRTERTKNVSELPMFAQKPPTQDLVVSQVDLGTTTILTLTVPPGFQVEQIQSDAEETSGGLRAVKIELVKQAEAGD